jgi:hypothetical protein
MHREKGTVAQQNCDAALHQTRPPTGITEMPCTPARLRGYHLIIYGIRPINRFNQKHDEVYSAVTFREDP